MKRGLIDKNPFDLVEIPIIKKTISLEDEEFENFYTREQLVEFLRCFEKEGELKYYAYFHLLSFSGVFCNRKVQRIATKYTECCHPIFSYFLDNAFVKRKLWPVYEIIWAW